MNAYQCAEARWNLPRPVCTCGEDSGRTLPSLTCPLYLWHHGCCEGKVFARSCPDRGCNRVFAFCATHGGDERAIAEVQNHLG